MRFSFTVEQLAFRDAVRGLFAARCPPSVVRESWNTDTGLNPGLWTALGEMGVLGLLVPEAHGGLGLAVIDLVLIVEEAGYAGLPDPLIEHALVAAPLLVEINAKSQLLANAVNGANVVTVAGFDRAQGIVHAPQAAGIVAMIPGGIGLLDRPIGSVTRLPTVDAAIRRYGVVGLPTIWPAGERLPGDPAVASAAAFNRGALGTAAFLIGSARRCLDLAVAYISERRQFGVPVGSFQALKHQMATALMQLEFARPAVYRAAQSISTNASTTDRDVSMAKAMAADAARLVARTSLQAHGAIGYTVEYDLHLWFKRIFGLAPTWGDSAWHADRVGRSLGI